MIGLAAGIAVLVGAAACSPGAEQGSIAVRNTAGRSGAYYLPAGPRRRPLPVLVFLHPTGGSGEGGIEWWRALADTHRFAVIAPDSRRTPDGQLTWQPGSQPGEVTPDLDHVLSCIRWVRAQRGVEVDTAHVLLAGHSGGASSAAYIASNRALFTHFAVLHGGVFPGGLGSRRVPAWVSTGEQDRVRPVTLVRQSADVLERLGFPVTFRTYPGMHGPGEAELHDVVGWWLGQ